MKRDIIFFNQNLEIIALLRSEKERTGVSGMALLKGRKDKPQKLSSSIVYSWLSAAIVSAYKEDVDYILGLYSSLPDNYWVTIDEELQAEINKIGSKHTRKIQGILKRSPEFQDVNYHNVNIVLRGIPKKCRKRTLDFIFSLDELG